MNGRIVKHTGDGALASFTSVMKAVEATVGIPRGSTEEGHGRLAKIGLTVGEPVEESDDIFGASVNLAARICAHAVGGQILASSSVRDLAIGKDIEFTGIGEVGLKGFPEPVRLYEIAWPE